MDAFGNGFWLREGNVLLVLGAYKICPAWADIIRQMCFWDIWIFLHAANVYWVLQLLYKNTSKIIQTCLCFTKWIQRVTCKLYPTLYMLSSFIVTSGKILTVKSEVHTGGVYWILTGLNQQYPFPWMFDAMWQPFLLYILQSFCWSGEKHFYNQYYWDIIYMQCAVLYFKWITVSFSL